MLEQEDSVPSPISAKSCQASAIWCTLSGKIINLVFGTCCLSSPSLLLAMPKSVDLNERTTLTILSNFRAGRHDRSLAESAVYLKWCCWPLSIP